MRVDEACPEEKEARWVCLINELHCSVADPVGPVEPGRHLRRLRDVVHLSTAAERIVDMFVSVGVYELHVIVVLDTTGQFLLMLPSLKTA